MPRRGPPQSIGLWRVTPPGRRGAGLPGSMSSSAGRSPGALDLTFGDQTRFGTSTYAVLPQPDGGLIVGGDFTGIGPRSIGRLARLGADGKVDTAFNAGGFGANDIVRTLAPSTDGKFYAAGRFTTYNGQPCPPIVRLLANGQRDDTFPRHSGRDGRNSRGCRACRRHHRGVRRRGQSRGRLLAEKMDPRRPGSGVVFPAANLQWTCEHNLRHGGRTAGRRHRSGRIRPARRVSLTALSVSTPMDRSIRAGRPRRRHGRCECRGAGRGGARRTAASWSAVPSPA